MKKLTIILLSFSLLLFSGVATASVHGTWNMEKIEKSSLKIGKAKPVTEIENFMDVWIFKDDNSFSSVFFSGIWSQKGSSFNITVDTEQVRALIESELLSDGLSTTATIKKLRIYGSEKKDWTIKGKYEIKADLVFPDASTGKLDIKGSFTGTLPYDTAEYFPLVLGDTWTTREIQTEITQEGEEVDEDMDTSTVFGTENIKGVIAMKRGDIEGGSYDLMTNTKGLIIYKNYDSDFEDDVLVNEIVETYNPPLMYLPPRLSVGTRHAFKSTMTHKESSGFNATAKITVDLVVEGIENVTVPAGNFQDCLRIWIKRGLIAKKFNHEESSESTYWFAKGVGIVKREENSTEINNNVVEKKQISTAELLSATVGGVNYPVEVWKQNPGNGHNYRLTPSLSWQKAEALAVEWGGHLVTINDRGEELWLRDNFGSNEHLWTGFNDITTEGQWKWVSGEPVTYTNWWAGEPNNQSAEGEAEDAMIMNWGGGMGGTYYYGDGWNDNSINNDYRGIVEVP